MDGNLFQKLYGTATVLRHCRAQRSIPFLRTGELYALRDKRLRATVRYAAAYVPFYRAWFERNKIAPHDIRSVKDLGLLPLIDKQAVHRDPSQFVSTSELGQKSIPFLTSGTTGMRLRIHHDRRSLLENIAYGERERAVVQKCCGKSIGYRELYIGYSAWTIAKVWRFYEQATLLPFKPKRAFISVLQPVERIAQLINDFRPDVILGWGSFLELLFRQVHSRRIALHRPRVINYGADAITPEGKELIEQEFQITVLSHYAAVECFKIGFFCEQSRRFHLHEDLCHLRVVDTQGHELPTGTKGQVILSNFVNRGTVLLNYALGDLAAAAEELCACGRTLALLSNLEGRVEDVVWLPNGTFVHPRIIWSVFRGRNEVLRYQLIQHEALRFELKLLTSSRHAFEATVRDITSELQHLLGPSAAIEAHFADELAEPSEGKFRSVRSYCKPAG